MLQQGLAQAGIVARTVVRRLDDWNAVVNGAFENLTVDAGDAAFEGVLDVRRFGGLSLSRISSSAAVVRRHRPSGAEPHGRYFKLHIQESGSSLNVQDGHEAVLGAGDLMLCDSSRPYSIQFETTNRMLVLRLPEDRLAARFEDPDALVGRRMGVESLGASLLSGFVRSLWTAPAAGDEAVQQGLHDALVERLVQKAAQLPVGDPAGRQVALGPLISRGQLERVDAIVRDSVAAGARLAAGGTHEGLFYRPTVLTGVRPGMRAFDEEIFGPVAVVTAFCDDVEAADLANRGDHGLSAGVITASVGRGMALGERLEVGHLLSTTRRWRLGRTRPSAACGPRGTAAGSAVPPTWTSSPPGAGRP